MAAQSDAQYDLASFKEESTHPSTIKLNESLVQRGKEDVKWWQVGPQKYRELRAAGKAAFPPPILLSRGEDIFIEVTTTSGQSHEIRCRVFRPSAGRDPKYIFYHIHGGGFVLGSAEAQDQLLAAIADGTQCLVISVEYRLAPEHPFPAAQEDCIAVADWLLQNGQEKFACNLAFLGGESAGATLCVFVLLHLRARGQSSCIKGTVLNYGCFDLGMLPSARLASDVNTPILTPEIASHFLDTFLQDMSIAERKAGAVSPMYNELHGLGNALFLVGTEDALVDDTVLMHFRWLRAGGGNAAVLKFLPGAPHGFMTFDGTNPAFVVTEQGWQIMVDYINDVVRTVEGTATI